MLYDIPIAIRCNRRSFSFLFLCVSCRCKYYIKCQYLNEMRFFCIPNFISDYHVCDTWFCSSASAQFNQTDCQILACIKRFNKLYWNYIKLIKLYTHKFHHRQEKKHTVSTNISKMLKQNAKKNFAKQMTKSHTANQNFISSAKVFVFFLASKQFLFVCTKITCNILQMDIDFFLTQCTIIICLPNSCTILTYTPTNRSFQRFKKIESGTRNHVYLHVA